jgi:hypothetical protein
MVKIAIGDFFCAVLEPTTSHSAGPPPLKRADISGVVLLRFCRLSDFFVQSI